MQKSPSQFRFICCECEKEVAITVTTFYDAKGNYVDDTCEDEVNCPNCNSYYKKGTTSILKSCKTLK